MEFLTEHSCLKFIFKLSRWFLLLLLVLPFKALALPEPGTTIVLDGEVEFAEIDLARAVIYVSIEGQNKIDVISAVDFQIIDSIEFDGQPKGLDLSEDGSVLYAAINGTGEIASVDLNDGNYSFSLVDVTFGLTHESGNLELGAFDVLSVGDFIFVTANPDSSNFANAAVVDTSNSNLVSKVGLTEGGFFNIIRSAPTLSVSSNENEIFISEEDDGLFRIDISQPQFPIIASQRVNGAGGTVILEDPDTQELTTSEGGIFRAANFEEVGEYVGREFITTNDDEYLIGQPSRFAETLVSYRIGDLAISNEIEIENHCSSPNLPDEVTHLLSEPSNSGTFVFLEDHLCFFAVDSDDDQIYDLVDNCPLVANPEQLNSDDDRLGNVCDDDDDNDLLPDGIDPFPISADGDNDGVDDFRDAFPLFFGAAFDSDGDGQPDSFFDTCDATCQAESGLVEDFDDDNDSIPDSVDPQPLIADQGSRSFEITSTRFLNLPSEPADIAVDFARSLAYVSLPEERQIWWISTKDLSVVFTREVSGEPGVLELSEDGSELIIALNDAGKVEFLDLTSPTLESETLDISVELGSEFSRVLNIFDLLATSRNRLFVAGSSESGRPTDDVVEINLDSRTVVRRVDFAGGLLAVNSNSSILYSEDGPAVSTFDISQAGAPRLMRELQTSNDTKRGFTLSQNGEFLFTGDGEVIPTDDLDTGLESFTETIDYGPFGSDAVTAASPNVLEQSIIDTSANVLFSFNTNSFVKTGQINAPCGGLENNNHIPLFKHAQGDRGWLISKLDGTQYNLCFQPRPSNYSDDFALPPTSSNVDDYFSLVDTTRIVYEDSIGSLSTRGASGRSRVIDGVRTFEFTESSGESEFFSRSNDGIFLHLSEEEGEQSNEVASLEFAPPIPVLPEQMRQGFSSFQSGSLVLRLGAIEDQVSYSGLIIIDDYQDVVLADGAILPAFRVRRETEISSAGSVTEITEFFWFSDGFGLVQIQEESERSNGQTEIVTTRLAFSDVDTDGDGILDSSDPDDDNDGVPDNRDAFPRDPNESSDFDRDGIGDNRDLDDDGDGLPDEYELDNGLNPFDRTDAAQDADGDGRSNIDEFRQGTDPQDAEDFSVPIAPIIDLLLDE